MGWMSWERFRCNTDCRSFPADCISERLVKETADSLVVQGFKEAGYQYVIIDDCWLAKDRDEMGCLKPDHDRFPSGMPALSKHIHDRSDSVRLCTFPSRPDYAQCGGEGVCIPYHVSCLCRGLKFGMYGDIGSKTCGGYPGMQGHLERDADTYASWGVDYLKVCSGLIYSLSGL